MGDEMREKRGKETKRWRVGGVKWKSRKERERKRVNEGETKKK